MAPEVVFSTSSVFPNTELGFRLASELGYDGVEVMVNHEKRSQNPDQILGLIKTYEMPVTAVHVPCLVITQPVWGWNPEVKLHRSVELAEDVGASAVVVHPPFRWQREQSESFAQLIIELQKRHAGSIEITLENMYSVEKFGRKVEPYLWYDDPTFERFGSLCLDTSHAAAARLDPIDLYKKMGGRVGHIHLSDSTGKKGDEHLAPGEGTLPLRELAQLMMKDGFDGQIVLEVATGKLPSGMRRNMAAHCLEWTREAYGIPSAPSS